MDPLTTFVLIGALVVAAAWLAPRLRLPAPLVQLLLGLLVGLLPEVRSIHLPSDAVLVLFLPALLFWEALMTPLREVRRDLRVILLLSTLLVVATTFGTAGIGVALGWGWLPALVLGAALAPTDATAVGALARALPHRNVIQLRAESLVNDGTALVIYTIVIGLAASGAHYSGWEITGLVGLAYGGGAVVGLLAGLLGTFVLRRLTDPLLHNAALVLVPFASFLAAEQIHASGVIAVVIAGLYLSRTGPRSGTPQSRQQRDGFWTLATTTLNGALFVLIGIEAQSAMRSVPLSSIPMLLVLCVLIWIAILLIRFGFQMITTWGIRLVDRSPAQRQKRMTHRARVVSTVAGFRGAISLAVALAVPADMPGRAEIIFVATGVIILTILAQGMLLPAVIRWARFEPDTMVAAEFTRAHRAALLSAIHASPGLAREIDVPEHVRERVVEEYRDRLERIGAAPEPGRSTRRDLDHDYAALSLALVDHTREVVIRLRNHGAISDATLHRLQTRLDRDALHLTPASAERHD
ncbi:sodium/proton antiporter, CPA1 family [Microbacterium azadirachtae]|uniref:Sodium/proton antiporter, CPA1 family n=1 Tax=Microbacterium azadirachtae TaxID=582680 RepID=A0A1I6J2V5_9MICO|nr:Na+/H+ antiporter [Microbacterium azadirachtae]SFR73201.1 sodium/proton antiporter, CPA1 family [Microbacterium azadirachtae]